MMHSPHRDRRRGGFSLVELMVVLLIMASLATVATVSVETTQDKVRADKTAALGREIVEALERSEGLSFVSDFGRLPKSEDELKFLFSQKVKIDTGTSIEERPADLYELKDLELPTTPGLPGSTFSKFQEAFGTVADGTAPTMGFGWRGPYSLVTELRGEDGEASEFLDGWKNEWDVMLDGTTGSFAGLSSPGRNGQTGGTEWQDKDLGFNLRRNPEEIDFHGQVFIRGEDTTYENQSQFDSLTLKVVYFTPDFSSSTYFQTGDIATVEFTWTHDTPGSWEKHPMTRTEEASENPFLFRLSGLTSGHRTMFVYAYGTPNGGDATHYAGGVRLLPLQPGTNRMEFWLNEIN